ncbi:MAG: hypothetical protein DRN14_03900, partial [Thermoplasmata archaeon]
YIRKIEEIVLKSVIEDQGISDGFNVNIAPIDSFKRMYVKLSAVGYGDPKEIFSGDTDGLNIVIDENKFLLESTRSYVLAIEVEKENGDKTGWKYYPVKFN